MPTPHLLCTTSDGRHTVSYVKCPSRWSRSPLRVRSELLNKSTPICTSNAIKLASRLETSLRVDCRCCMRRRRRQWTVLAAVVSGDTSGREFLHADYTRPPGLALVITALCSSSLDSEWTARARSAGPAVGQPAAAGWAGQSPPARAGRGHSTRLPTDRNCPTAHKSTAPAGRRRDLPCPLHNRLDPIMRAVCARQWPDLFCQCEGQQVWSGVGNNPSTNKHALRLWKKRK